MIGGVLDLDSTNRVASLILSDAGSSITVPMIVDPTGSAHYTKSAAAAAYRIYQNDAGSITVDGVLTTDANGFHCIHL